MKVSIIVPISSNVPIRCVNAMIRQWKRQTVDVEVIVSCHGRLKRTPDCEHYVQFPSNRNFSLSKARNKGALLSRRRWIAFTDCDIYYKPDLFENMANTGSPVTIGKTIVDIGVIGQEITRQPYRCGAAPLLIERELFNMVGGYCELYEGWGYEDSDFEHKLIDVGCPVKEFDSIGRHVLSVHREIRKKSTWEVNDDNKDLFWKRKKEDVQERIAQDRRNYG